MQKAIRIFSRLTEVEKMAIRSATPGGLDHLANTSHLSDMPLESFDERCAIMREIHSLCTLELAAKASDPGFNGVTWKF